MTVDAVVVAPIGAKTGEVDLIGVVTAVKTDIEAVIAGIIVIGEVDIPVGVAAGDAELTSLADPKVDAACPAPNLCTSDLLIY